MVRALLTNDKVCGPHRIVAAKPCIMKRQLVNCLQLSNVLPTHFILFSQPCTASNLICLADSQRFWWFRFPHSSAVGGKKPHNSKVPLHHHRHCLVPPESRLCHDDPFQFFIFYTRFPLFACLVYFFFTMRHHWLHHCDFCTCADEMAVNELRWIERLFCVTDEQIRLT